MEREMKEERKERKGWIEEWVNECTHSRSFLTSGVTPNPGSWVMESLMCVTSLCLCGTTHTHTHRNGVAKTSICQINNPWRIKHTLEYERILLGGFFLMLIDILDLYSHITVYRTLASAVFFLQTEAHLHSHTLMISIAAICTPRCN